MEGLLRSFVQGLAIADALGRHLQGIHLRPSIEGREMTMSGHRKELKVKDVATIFALDLSHRTWSCVRGAA